MILRLSKNHAEMYETINSTPVGDVSWESFTLEYDGVRPDGDIPMWMTAEYEYLVPKPSRPVHNIISNPVFESRVLTTHTARIYNGWGNRFQNLMSGDWCGSKL